MRKLLALFLLLAVQSELAFAQNVLEQRITPTTMYVRFTNTSWVFNYNYSVLDSLVSLLPTKILILAILKNDIASHTGTKVENIDLDFSWPNGSFTKLTLKSV